MLDVSAKRTNRSAGRRKTGESVRRERMATAVQEYAALGWPCYPGEHTGDDTRACSCDRIGCPSPAAHPRSQVWQRQATVDADTLARWWMTDPDANIVLPTGRVFDVFDVPAKAGQAALDEMEREGVAVGPVANHGDERYLFFVATRGAPVDEDEWWSCHLDTVPESIEDSPGMRWHCRDSYVLAPPSVLPFDRTVTWVREPHDAPLPDPVRLLEILADACD
ncbi:bifunctional DNA primase/polymerase [Actinoallomurus sp. NPDC050550]|uniref:bifunctional DNA primase/polymerase n=1 Tax=Actinoallomurus sp. NPDC050550 TaxID=3154937 RepID=UPI0033EE067A